MPRAYYWKFWEVEMVGGGWRIPKIQSMLVDYLKDLKQIKTGRVRSKAAVEAYHVHHG